MNNRTNKFFLISILLVLVVSNIIAYIKIDELSSDVKSLKNDLSVVINNNNNLSNDIYRIKSDLLKIEQEQSIISNANYCIESADESSQTVRIKLYFVLNEVNINDTVSVVLSSSFADETAVAMLENGTYTAEFDINTSSNYKAVLHIQSSDGTIKSMLLLENINSHK